jgi:hypothetical protein
MGLIFSDRPVLYAAGHYKHLAWTKPNGALSQLNSDMPSENQKEVVGIVVLVCQTNSPLTFTTMRS